MSRPDYGGRDDDGAEAGAVVDRPVRGASAVDGTRDAVGLQLTVWEQWM